MRHKLSQIDKQNKTALCSMCGIVPIQYRYRKLDAWRCSIKARDRDYKKNGWRKMGIQRDFSLITYNEMLLRQNGLCLICKKPPKKRGLYVDHDHLTGKVRGLLCNNCNIGLGFFKDNTEYLKSAILYLNYVTRT